MNDAIKEMTHEFGPECPDFDPACACCVGWKFYKESGEVPTDEEVFALIRYTQD